MLKLLYLVIFFFSLVSQIEIIVTTSHSSWRAGEYYRPRVGAMKAEWAQNFLQLFC